MEITPQQHRRAFDGWIRTGFWRVPSAIDPAVKFNPNHDERGRFTFGGGGSSGGGGASGSWQAPRRDRMTPV